MAQNKQSFAGKIQELQEEIKNLEGQSYWDATKTMNEYLIRYAMAEDEDIDSDSITFGEWYVNNATSKGYENENYGFPLPSVSQRRMQREIMCWMQRETGFMRK